MKTVLDVQEKLLLIQQPLATLGNVQAELHNERRSVHSGALLFSSAEPASQSTNVAGSCGSCVNKCGFDKLPAIWTGYASTSFKAPILAGSENVDSWYAHPSGPFQCKFSCWFELNLIHCRPKLSSDLGNVCFSGPRVIQPPPATTAHLLSRRQAESSESLTKIRLPSGSHAIPLSTSGPSRPAAFASAAAPQNCFLLGLGRFHAVSKLASVVILSSQRIKTKSRERFATRYV